MPSVAVRARLVVELAVLTVFAVGVPAAAVASPGDLVASVTFSQDCSSGLGTWIAFNHGQYPWLTCWSSNPDLLRADRKTGAVSAAYDIIGGLGSCWRHPSRAWSSCTS